MWLPIRRRPASRDYGEIRAALILKAAEEGVVGLVVDETGNVEGEFADVVVTPHAGFVAGDLLTFGNIVPAIRLVIDRVQEETVVGRIDAEIRVGEEGAQRGETGLVVTLAVFGIGAEVAAELSTGSW